jgi:hypothetical protein
MLFIAILRASVIRLRNTWQQESDSGEQPRWVRLFADSEFWRMFFHWEKSRTLNRNPVAWLQEYSWTARLTKWGWFMLVLVAECIVLTRDGSRRSLLWQPLIIVTLGLGVAFSAVGSFRREQESGLLELLLVTPLSEQRLLRGRVWGICCHYFPAIGLIWVGWFGDHLLNPRLYSNEFVAAMVPNPVIFVSILVVGLWLSLSSLNFFLAWLLTWIMAFVVPILGRIELGRIAGAQGLVSSGLPLSFQIGLAALAWILLQLKVRHRNFGVAKGDTHLRV